MVIAGRKKTLAFVAIGGALAIALTTVLIRRWSQGLLSRCNTREECARLCDDRGDATSCQRLGEMLNRGILGEKDSSGAASRYKKACEGGIPGACTVLADLHLRGLGVPRDSAEAWSLFERACEQGSIPACDQLESRARFGLGVAPDGKAADLLASHATSVAADRCERQSDVNACIALAEHYASGRGSPRDDGQAAAAMLRARALRQRQCIMENDRLACLWSLDPQGQRDRQPGPEAWAALESRRCLLGYGRACASFASRTLSDRIRLQPESTEMLRRGCSLGDTSSCANMAERYEGGEGAPRDLALAQQYHEVASAIDRRACDNGDRLACWLMARKYEGGQGVTKDSRMADAFDAKAMQIALANCDVGVAFDCSWAATDLSTATSPLRRDQARAAVLFGKGCQLGDAAACGALAQMYETGNGIPVDRVRAMQLHSLACDKGAEESCFAIGEVERGIMGYQAGCDEGWAADCELLAGRFARGEGVAEDEKRAAALHERACALGYSGHGCAREKGFPPEQ